jgi:hypothetical protein
MFLGESVKQTRHFRQSKLGKKHEYYRQQTIVHFRCDCCDVEFSRPRGSMNPKRLSNNYFHVCEKCDAKRFAQKRGVERRKIWDLTASSDLPISKL